MVFIGNAFILKPNSCLFNHFVDVSKLHSGKIINVDFHVRKKIYKIRVLNHFTNQSDIKLPTF